VVILSLIVFSARTGEFAALGTAILWTVTALTFESAGRKIGSLALNILRLAVASAIFALYGWIVRGVAFPLDVPAASWGWLALSGIVGFVIGDLLLFQAFVLIGARISMLIYASVPPLTAVLALLFLDERLDVIGCSGMALTVSGIVLVVLRRPPGTKQDAGARSIDGPTWLKGISLAFGGSLGQAGGLILGRIGAGLDLDPFVATQIRALAGVAGFAIVFSVIRRWRQVSRGVRNGPAMIRLSFGALFGPFLGVSLGLYAAQHTSAGIASTIMALVPVLIIIPSVIIFKERITPREVLGALIAVSGVALLFL